jgi:hypothetical protein
MGIFNPKLPAYNNIDLEVEMATKCDCKARRAVVIHQGHFKESMDSVESIDDIETDGSQINFWNDDFF